ncbi:MAG: hypothetical protein OR994_02265 [Candidatus Poseidoniales archaeon]|nr:hypothetical protein [Candidatus Poseidoniales archaeon]
MLLHHSSISSVRLELLNGEEIISKRSSTHPLSMKSLEREFQVITELQNRGLDFGLLSGQNNNFEVAERSIKFKRKGTHDLSDLGHDLTVGEFFDIIANLAIEITKIHSNGYVHRDIKPGNIMVTQAKNGAKKYAGIVDFGLALKINRTQNEPGIAGGTRPFFHPSQTKDKERAHLGQDWFSVALTSLYFMRASVDSLEAEINSSSNGILIDLNQIANGGQQTIHLGGDINSAKNYFQCLADLIQRATSASCDIEEIAALGKSLSKAAKSYVTSKANNNITNKDKPLPITGNKIAKHDVLLIIDETNSLSSEIDRIKATIEEVVQEFDGTMDLRVDLWTVRDYARKGANQKDHQTVRKVGYRLTARTMAYAIGEIAADAVQHDEAEAYEMAFEEAAKQPSKKVKGEHLWLPRDNTTRTVVLAGDAYAHGWLRKPWWFVWLGLVKTGEASEVQRKSKFTINHPGALNQSVLNNENWAREQRLQKEQDSIDQFGAQHELVPDSKGGTQSRPNAMNVVKRLRDQKKCTIHTICLGDDIVAKSYMKFVACIGDGVNIEGKNDFVDALVGIIASPDKLLYQKLLNRNSISVTAKQNLTPLTTFVLK